jgi:hypothetical protein
MFGPARVSAAHNVDVVLAEPRHACTQLTNSVPVGGAVLIERGGCDFSIKTQHGTVRVFRQMFALEDATGSHACSLEANMHVTNGTPLGIPLLLPVGTVNCVQTLKGNTLVQATL